MVLEVIPGDPPTPDQLAESYEPHIIKWSEHATPSDNTLVLEYGARVGNRPPDVN